MQIRVSEPTKINLARNGLPNKLFSDEVAVKRKNMSEEKLIKIFDEVWKQRLEKAIASSQPCESEAAKERLPETYRSYFDPKQNHREFRISALNLEFLAQLLPLLDDEYELTQLWKIPSSDRDPRWLIVRFDTLSDRQEFERIAKLLDFNDAELGKKLLLDFMEKFSNL